MTPEDRIDALSRAIARLEERARRPGLSEVQRSAVGKLICELRDVRLQILKPDRTNVPRSTSLSARHWAGGAQSIFAALTVKGESERPANRQRLDRPPCARKERQQPKQPSDRQLVGLSNKCASLIPAFCSCSFTMGTREGLAAIDKKWLNRCANNRKRLHIDRQPSRKCHGA